MALTCTRHPRQLVSLRSFVPRFAQPRRHGGVRQRPVAASVMEILREAQLLERLQPEADVGELAEAASVPPCEEWHLHPELLQG